MSFKDLIIGQSFDFIDDAAKDSTTNSFFKRCTKTSARKYTADGLIHKVGTINCSVYHVGRQS